MLDADSSKVVWTSKDQHLDSWTSQFFPTRRAVNALLKVEGQGEFVAALINGIPLPLDQEPAVNRNRLEFTYSALPMEGIELTLILNSPKNLIKLELIHFERLKGDIIWLRYKVVR